MPELTPASFAFADAVVDRADALRNDPAALRRIWPEARLLLLDADGNAYADADGRVLLLTGAALGDPMDRAIFLGLCAGDAWFAMAAAALDPDLEPPQRMDLRRAAGEWPAADAGLFAYARGMLHWQSRTRFCGVCGGAIALRRGGFLGVCTQCASEHYPRVDPAVIVAVGDGARLLLGRQASWPARRYSVIAGFVEPGESLEQTVAREVAEETQVRVRPGSCRYYGAQPWPFPGALMLGFSALAEPDAPQVDGELEDARWFERAEIGGALQRAAAQGDGADDRHGLRLPPRISIAHALVEDWYRRGGDPA
ncbi:NAD(+) diphosphatase [Xanthomonas hyacinthi]|uniref:NAD(+) diphosphatase n=1 Tax=Xanthomonas hyacinthi TaxID=56455 RepID=A0A2S7EXU2_9XANT|nr:NAD(+) diphosphatase [Xanthomonas hyacinthi]KLD76887.1 NADH pyrophosphatase [Xanthomonas hyacinthi DSM 19077]PPU97951.1 NAD(+) diphosphatase [Xanthomonas hyacinthi]QGY76507.1 NAD(+) diphosphatase [Xanthomonas hyacinthi]